MADITMTNIPLYNTAVLVSENSSAAAFTIPTFDHCNRILILVDNQESATNASLNILATNAIGNAAGQGNLKIDINATELEACVIESARFKNVDGEVECTLTNQNGTSYSGTYANVKVSVFRMPA